MFPLRPMWDFFFFHVKYLHNILKTFYPFTYDMFFLINILCAYLAACWHQSKSLWFVTLKVHKKFRQWQCPASPRLWCEQQYANVSLAYQKVRRRRVHPIIASCLSLLPSPVQVWNCRERNGSPSRWKTKKSMHLWFLESYK